MICLSDIIIYDFQGRLSAPCLIFVMATAVMILNFSFIWPQTTRVPLFKHTPLERATLQIRSQQLCTPQTHVFYLKIGKTGSSTITNILYRYGLKHNLTMIPTYNIKTMNIAHELLLRPGETLREHYGKHHYHASHYVYDHDDLTKVAAKDTVFFASTRDPMSRLRSQLKENEWYSRLRINESNGDPLVTFNKHFIYRPGYQMQSVTQFMSLDWIKDKEQRLLTARSRFDPVLIAEYMDESLILLRRKLCWDIRDIVYIPQRVRNYAYKSALMPWPVVKYYMRVLKSDYELYDYFLKILFREMETNIFRQEVLIFKTILSQVNSFCNNVYEKMFRNSTTIYGIITAKSFITLHPEPFGSTFNLTGFDCALMKIEEKVFKAMLLRKQAPWLCNSTERYKLDGWSPEICSGVDLLGLSLRNMNKRETYISF